MGRHCTSILGHGREGAGQLSWPACRHIVDLVPVCAHLGASSGGGVPFEAGAALQCQMVRGRAGAVWCGGDLSRKREGMRVISHDTYAKYAKKYGIALKSGVSSSPCRCWPSRFTPTRRLAPSSRVCTFTDVP